MPGQQPGQALSYRSSLSQLATSKAGLPLSPSSTYPSRSVDPLVSTVCLDGASVLDALLGVNEERVVHIQDDLEARRKGRRAVIVALSAVTELDPEPKGPRGPDCFDGFV